MSSRPLTPNICLTVPAADNVIRLLPALNIHDADITEALARLERCRGHDGGAEPRTTPV